MIEKLEEENKTESNEQISEETNEVKDEKLELKVEKGIDEKKAKNLTSNVYDPELGPFKL